ncbi:MAG: Gfo/Idh/MocA family oxidoreductase [Bacillota bacterium]
MRKLKLAVIGAGGRGNAYSSYALTHPDEVEMVMVAEPREGQRQTFAEKYKITDENCFNDYDEFFMLKRDVDLLLICTQDKMHFEPAMIALEQGYDVLLEKPMTPNSEECKALVECSERTGKILAICHVLRYTSFFSKLKSLIDEGRIGKLVSMSLDENIAYWHFSHSYVRGPWANSKESSPIILAKSCHDLDILYWYADSKCKSISSFGDLVQFKAENAPEGAPKRCSDGCPVKNDCLYYAPNIYVHDEHSWLSTANRSSENISGILEGLKTSEFGRCVYHCENDVPDHMVTAMEFENGVTATFNLNAYTNECYRTIKLRGTLGEISGNIEEDKIEIVDFKSGETHTIELKKVSSGHGGGDTGIMQSLVTALSVGGKPLTNASESLQSHLMAFAAEQSRVSGKTVDLLAENSQR